jgi:predicted HicB family RNase H-like nuclease
MKKVVSVCLSAEVHEKAKQLAEKNGVSVSAWISMLIAKQK